MARSKKNEKKREAVFDEHGLLYRFWTWYFSECKEVFDAEVFVALARHCSSSFDSGKNMFGVIETSYADLARECRKDWRCIKRSLTIMENCGILKMRQSGRGIYVIILDAVKYDGKTTKLYDGMKKEKKERRKLSPPYNPSLIKEEKEKEEKCEKEENTPAFDSNLSLEERKERFKMEVGSFLESYGRATCNEFFATWTELTPDGKMMRFELEKTWNTATRLERWKRYDAKFKPKEKTVSKEEIEIRKQERAKEEDERRQREIERDERALGSCPPWIINMAREQGCESFDTEEISQYLYKAREAGFLGSEEVKKFNIWYDNREKLKKKLKKV